MSAIFGRERGWRLRREVGVGGVARPQITQMKPHEEEKPQITQIVADQDEVG